MKLLPKVTAQAKAGTVLVILHDVEAEALFETQVDTPLEANAERLGDTPGDVESKRLFDTLAKSRDPREKLWVKNRKRHLLVEVEAKTLSDIILIGEPTGRGRTPLQLATH